MDAKSADVVEIGNEDKSSTDSDLEKSDKEQPVRWCPIIVVLAVELCERLTYYTFAGSQKTYMNKNLGFSPSSAASVNSVFSMLCYMWCLPGGLAADVIGRYKVIVTLSSLYALGTIVSAISVHAGLQQKMKFVFLVGALVMIPIGTGGIKPNICNFGADQIGDQTESQKNAQKRYFSFFYMAINAGVIFAFGYLINVTTHGAPKLGIELEEGYFAAYLAAALSMVTAVMIFVGFTRLFRLSSGGGIDGFKTMVNAVVYSVKTGGGWRAWCCAIGWCFMPVFFVITFAAALQSEPPSSAVTPLANGTEVYHYPNMFEEKCGPPVNFEPPGAHRRLDDYLVDVHAISNSTFAMRSDAFSCAQAWVASSSVDTSESDSMSAPVRRLHGGGGGGGQVGQLLAQFAFYIGTVSCFCLTLAHLNNGWIKLPQKQIGDSSFNITDVRAGFATVPLIIVVNLAFSIPYNAMNNAFPSQACQMNTIINGAQLNGAFFNLADALAILIFTPIFEAFVYPGISNLKGSPVRLGQKLISGLIVAAIANMAAAYLEIKRRHTPMLCSVGFSECAPNGIHMRDISAFWMFVPFSLIGMAEILVNPCMYYFAYTAAPPNVRSLVQAFNLFFQGSVSNAFTAVAMKATFPNDLDSGNLEYYYFVNVVCAFVGILLYFYVTRCGNNGEDIKEEIRDEELDATEHHWSERGMNHEELQSSTSEE